MRACKCGSALDYAAEGVTACYSCRPTEKKFGLLVGHVEAIFLKHQNETEFSAENGWSDQGLARNGIRVWVKIYNSPLPGNLRVYATYTNQHMYCQHCNTTYSSMIARILLNKSTICNPCLIKANNP